MGGCWENQNLKTPCVLETTWTITKFPCLQHLHFVLVSAYIIFVIQLFSLLCICQLFFFSEQCLSLRFPMWWSGAVPLYPFKVNTHVEAKCLRWVQIRYQWMASLLAKELDKQCLIFIYFVSLCEMLILSVPSDCSGQIMLEFHIIMVTL